MQKRDRQLFQKTASYLYVLFQDRGHQTLSNDTLVKIRTLDRHVSSSNQTAAAAAASPAGANRDNGNNNLLPVVDETAESLLDFDDLSFEDTREELVGETSGRQYRQTRRYYQQSSLKKCTYLAN